MEWKEQCTLYNMNSMEKFQPPFFSAPGFARVSYSILSGKGVRAKEEQDKKLTDFAKHC